MANWKSEESVKPRGERVKRNIFVVAALSPSEAGVKIVTYPLFSRPSMAPLRISSLFEEWGKKSVPLRTREASHSLTASTKMKQSAINSGVVFVVAAIFLAVVSVTGVLVSFSAFRTMGRAM